MNNMTTKELRDILTEKRALYRESLARADVARDHIQEVLSGIDPEFLDKLQSVCGVNLEFLKNIDLEKVKADNAYLTGLQSQLTAGVAQLKTYIERSLNV